MKVRVGKETYKAFKMTIHEFSQVYGFTVKNPELFKLLLAKLDENYSKWSGYVATLNPECGTDDEDIEWTHNGLLYDFWKLSHFFIHGATSTAGQEMAHDLFPDLPEGVTLFHNPVGHIHTWHLGIEISYTSVGMWGFKKPIDPVKLVADHAPTLQLLKSRYGHLLKEEIPVIFEVTDGCSCCSDCCA